MWSTNSEVASRLASVFSCMLLLELAWSCCTRRLGRLARSCALSRRSGRYSAPASSYGHSRDRRLKCPAHGMPGQFWLRPTPLVLL